MGLLKEKLRKSEEDEHGLHSWADLQSYSHKKEIKILVKESSVLRIDTTSLTTRADSAHLKLQQELEKKKEIPPSGRRLSLDLRALFSHLILLSSPFFLRWRNREKVKLVPSSCVIGLRQKKPCWLPRIVNRFSNLLTSRNIFSLFVDPYQNIVPGGRLILRQDCRSFVVFFWAPLVRMCNFVNGFL